MSASLRDRVLGSPGYDCSMWLGEEELIEIRQHVENLYLNALQASGIKNYGDHELLLPKKRRLFGKSFVHRIKELPFMAMLSREFGPFTISDVVLPDGTVEHGREEIYWRIVRPNEPGDVGPLHRDSDFHTKEGTHAGKQTVKCWIPLYCEEFCGLVIRDEKADIELPVYKPGEIALFNANILHYGAINRGKTARVSVEITLVLQ